MRKCTYQDVPVSRDVIYGNEIAPNNEGFQACHMADYKLHLFLRADGSFTNQGWYLGRSGDGHIPEVIEDEMGVYVLIFRRKACPDICKHCNNMDHPSDEIWWCEENDTSCEVASVICDEPPILADGYTEEMEL